MGRRRIRCLNANGIAAEQIRLVDTREDRRAEARQTHGVEGFADLQGGMDWGPDVVIVSVPPTAHMDVCLTAARAGKHFFCEVPLSMSLDGTEELTDLVERQGLVAAPGSQPPFHPLVKQVKQWLEDPAFGKLLLFNQDWGQYLPDWHPYEDYRTFYAAKQGMGGGALDIVPHELVVYYWLTGDRIERLHCRGSHLSSLEIEGNETWQILAETRGGVRATLQYDLIQRAVHNVCRFVSEAGTIELDLPGSAAHGACARRYLASTGQWEQVTPPDGFEYEQCYVDEIAAFLRCLRGEATWHVSMATAVDIVRLLVAALESDDRHEWVEV